MEILASFAYTLAGVISFVLTLMIMPWLITKLKEAGVCGKDLNKPDKPLIPEMGGIGVTIGFMGGIYFLFFTSALDVNLGVMAALTTVIGVAFIGLLDDLVNLRHGLKAVLPFFAAIHLGFYAPASDINIPFFGVVDLKWAIVLVVPFGVTCAANATNMLEGFNGLGTGMGIILSLTLIVISLLLDTKEPLFLLVPLLGALCAFLIFNWYPAKVFPGDSLTFFIGATLACAAILANIKFLGAMLFLPMIVEFVLKFKGRFKAENFGHVTKDGYLEYDGPIESLAHILMKRLRLTEPKLVFFLWCIQGLVCLGVILIVLIGWYP